MTNSKIEELIKRLKQEDKSAIDTLFNYYYPRLYNFSKSILKVDDEIDDILQDVFFKIWMNRQKISNPETFNSYIFTITKNSVLNLIRSRINSQKFKDEMYRKSVSGEYITQNLYEFEQVKSSIDKLVAQLPEKRQQVFLLSRNEGLSNKEIAQKMNISEKTVEDHITHSIKTLKKSMTELGIFSLLYFHLFF